MLYFLRKMQAIPFIGIKMFWKPELKTSFLKDLSFIEMGKFLNSWIQVQIFKFLRTVSSYRIRYAEKNLAGITYRELGVTENKKHHQFNLLKCKDGTIKTKSHLHQGIVSTHGYQLLDRKDFFTWL